MQGRHRHLCLQSCHPVSRFPEGRLVRNHLLPGEEWVGRSDHNKDALYGRHESASPLALIFFQYDVEYQNRTVNDKETNGLICRWESLTFRSHRKAFRSVWTVKARQYR